jgi:hypothetical protein
MKRFFSFALCTSLMALLLCLGCKDKPATPTLEGKWKLVLVSDQQTGTFNTKPSNEPKEVTIQFIPTSATTGKAKVITLVNAFEADYTLTVHNNIDIRYWGPRLIDEATWANQFYFISGVSRQAAVTCTMGFLCVGKV